MINWTTVDNPKQPAKELYSDKEMFRVLTSSSSILNVPALNPRPRSITDIFDIANTVLSHINYHGYTGSPVTKSIEDSLGLSLQKGNDRLLVLRALTEILTLVSTNPIMKEVLAIFSKRIDLIDSKDFERLVSKYFEVEKTGDSNYILRPNNHGAIRPNAYRKPIIQINNVAGRNFTMELLHEVVAFLILFPYYTGKESIKSLPTMDTSEMNLEKRDTLPIRIRLLEHFVYSFHTITTNIYIRHLFKSNSGSGK